MEEIRVFSWTELQERLFEHTWNEELGLHRSNYAYRGRGDAAEDLSTKLAQLGGDAPALERNLLRNFRKYAMGDAAPDDSPWNWLALGQHHGLPTRLLDWTYSPYVALHFATSKRECFDRDGAIWMVDYVRAHQLAPKKLRDCLEAEGTNLFTTEMVESVAPDLGDLAKLDDDFVVFVEPPSFDDRIVNQYALFALASRADSSLDEWLREHEELCRRIVLPAELKWEVRDKLDQANITERVLFPGLDGLTRWLVRYHTPRTREPH